MTYDFITTAKVHDMYKITPNATCGKNFTQSIVHESINHRVFFPLDFLFFDFDSIFFFILSFFMRGSTTRKRPLTPGGRLTRLPTPFLPTTYVTFFFSDFNKPAFLYILSTQSNQLTVPPVKLSAYGPCSFAVAGPGTFYLNISAIPNFQQTISGMS